MKKLKTVLPYFAIVLGFIAFIGIFLLIFDQWIMPSVIHDKNTVKIPKLTGIPFDEAKKIIKESDLQFHIASEQFSYDYPVSTVLKQSPEPFTKVKAGRRIYLTISKGKESVTVPYLIGRDLTKVSFMLMERGLVLGDTSYVFSELYQKDTIIAQSKRAGSTAYYGDTIDLVISLGSEESVEMPQLIGKSLDDAEELVESLGLIIAVTHYIKNDGTYLPNTVINQSPKSNESVRRGTEVHLIIVGR